MLELLSLRERNSRRDTRLQGILQFIHTNVWRALFGRVRPPTPTPCLSVPCAAAWPGCVATAQRLSGSERVCALADAR